MSVWKFFAGKALPLFGAFACFGVASAAQVIADPTKLPADVMALAEWAKPERLGLLLTGIFAGLSAIGTVMSLISPSFSQKDGLALAQKAETIHEAVVNEGSAIRQRQSQSERDLNAKLDTILARLTPTDTALDPQREAQKAEAVERIEQSGDDADIRAIQEIAAGDVGQGFADLAARARLIEVEGNTRAAAKWRDLGVLAYDVAPMEALVAYRESNRLDPSDFWAAIHLSRLERSHGGDLVAARAAAERALALAATDRERSVALHELSDVAVLQGSLDDAGRLFDRYRDAANALLAANPTSAEAKRDVWVSLNKLGEVAVAQGHLDDARGLFDEGLGLARALLAANPSSAQAKRDVSVSLERLGNVAVAQGRLDDARGLFEESLGLARALLAANPSSAEAKRDVSVSLNRLGEVAVAQGRLDDARGLFEEGLGLACALLAANPSSAEAKRDVSVSLEKLAGLGGPDADGHWRACFAILREQRVDGTMLPTDEAFYQQLAARWGEAP